MHHKCGLSWPMSCLSWFQQGFWPCNFLRGKLVNPGWDKLAVGYTENWLYSKLKGDASPAAQNTSWGQLLVLFSCGWYWDQYCLTSSLMTQRVGQNVPSGILQLIQDWEELLIHQMVVLPFRGTLTDWELDTCTALVQIWHEKVMPYFPNGHLLNWHCIVLGIYCLQLTAQEVNGGGGGQII